MDSHPTNVTARGLSGAEIEYTILREESLKRMDQRQQVLSITVTLAGECSSNQSPVPGTSE